MRSPFPNNASSRRNWVAHWLQGRRRKRAASHAGPSVPNPPAGLNLSDSGNAIQLTWQDISSNEQGFRVYRKVDGGTFGLWQSLGAGVTTTLDNSVVVGHTYSYYVTAYNAAGESPATNPVSELYGS